MALVAALVLLYNKCEWFRNGVNAILGFFKEKLGAALEVARNISPFFRRFLIINFAASQSG